MSSAAEVAPEQSSFKVPQWWRDPRVAVALILFTYLVLGFTFLGFNRSPWQVAVTSISACALEGGLTWAIKRTIIFPLSALVTSFGLSLLLNYSHSFGLLFVPVLLAIGSKYILTFNRKHAYNPAQIAVTLCLLFSQGLITSAPAYQWNGIASADFDNTGRRGMIVTHMFQGPSIYKNEGPLTDPNEWIGFQLEATGTTCNRSGVGSVVTLMYEQNGKEVALTQQKQVATGFDAQNDPRLHFGLGHKAKNTRVKVKWCGGPETTTSNISTNTYQTLYMNYHSLCMN